MANKANANIRATLKINNGDDTFWPKRGKKQPAKRGKFGENASGEKA